MELSRSVELNRTMLSSINVPQIFVQSLITSVRSR